METNSKKSKCPCGLNSGYLRMNNVWHCTRCGRDTPQEQSSGDVDAAGTKE